VVEVLERELQRPSRLRRRASWGIASVVGLAGIGALWLAYETARPECPLADQIAAQPSTPAWSEFAQTMPGVAERFEAQIAKLEADAQSVCVSGGLPREKEARRQQLQTLLRLLERLPEHSPSRFPDFAQKFENALAAGPTQP